MRFTVAALALALIAPSLSAQTTTPEANTTPIAKDVVATAADNGSFTTFGKLLIAAGMVDSLQGAGPFTIFAPTDAAFAKLPEGTVDSLMTDIPRLREILNLHVLNGKVESKDVANMTSASSLGGSTLAITVLDGNVRINESNVVEADVQASNGVIHAIDTVLMPKKQTP